MTLKILKTSKFEKSFLDKIWKKFYNYTVADELDNEIQKPYFY